MPETFAVLWKNFFMNKVPLPSNVLVGAPRSANSDLMRQANQLMTRSNNPMSRKKIWSRLITSTQKKPAVVRALPAPGQPGAAAPGVGVSGYSGNNARVLGAPSNPGFENLPKPR